MRIANEAMANVQNRPAKTKLIGKQLKKIRTSKWFLRHEKLFTQLQRVFGNDKVFKESFNLMRIFFLAANENGAIETTEKNMKWKMLSELNTIGWWLA